MTGITNGKQINPFAVLRTEQKRSLMIKFGMLDDNVNNRNNINKNNRNYNYNNNNNNNNNNDNNNI